VVLKEQPQVVVKIEETDKDGDGVLDKDDACPLLPGPAENKGCPIEAPKDRDGDGITDNLDKCPDQPEDKDGFQDEDGCPDPDNDGDGILDTADKCPNEAGPMTNYGCPVKDQDGDGIMDDKDQCPTQPGPAANNGCPWGDKDGDGITDDKDKCPNEPEDKDGFQDDDGCPDLDNDGDGIPDLKDKCPNEPEDKDGFQDDDGCPDPDNDGDGILDDKDECPNQPGPAETKGCPKKYTMVVVTKDKIEIKKQIKFATGSSKIVGAESEQILRDVAQALKDNPQIKKIRIEGHTDSVGDDTFNLKLSQGRANSVMAALLRLGIDPGRMEAVGFGETRPIASNSTAAGKAENRRTEFNIVEQ
jgi:outer membrane protein OmpA-like peptidoglycan-associated protein